VGVVTRREMRALRLPHRATYVLVFNGRGELFVHLRSAGKDVYPSHWDSCVGGVLAAGEKFDTGAARELAEELGVEAPLERLLPIRDDGGQTIGTGMVYGTHHDGPSHLQAEEVVGGKFLAPAAVGERASPEPFCPDGRAALAEYRRWLEAEPS